MLTRQTVSAVGRNETVQRGTNAILHFYCRGILYRKFRLALQFKDKDIETDNINITKVDFCQFIYDINTSPYIKEIPTERDHPYSFFWGECIKI